METHNRDVFPSKEAREIYGLLGAVIENPLVDRPFSLHETEAVKAKRHYHLLGRVGVWFVVISTIFTVLESFILREYASGKISSAASHFISAASIFIIVLGISGVGVQLYLLLTGRKKSWLLNRFAAERLRSVKFQAYQLAQSATDEADFIAKVDEFYKTETARLGMELNAGEAALELFRTKGAIRPIALPRSPANARLASMARDAYRELRIEYQRRFAADEIRKLQNRKRVGYAVADILYLIGAALAIVALLGKIWLPIPDAVANLIDFFSVLCFILGLSKAILDNASLADSSEARYQNYIEAIAECDNDLKTERASFPEVVQRIESVVLDELSEFSRSASRISYRL